MNLGNKLAVGEVHDHGADDVAERGTIATPAPETVRAEARPEPIPAHAD